MFNESKRGDSEIPIDHSEDERAAEQTTAQEELELFLFIGSISPQPASFRDLPPIPTTEKPRKA